MDSKRARTYEALEQFIQSQRSILNNLRDDLVKLQDLRDAAAACLSSPPSPLSPTVVTRASTPPEPAPNETRGDLEGDSDGSDRPSISKARFLEDITARLKEDDNPLGISNLAEARLELPAALGSDLNWGLFSGSDAKHLQTFASTFTQAYASRNIPATKQTSSPTITQQFIRAGRRALLDPILQSSQKYIHELSLTLPPSDDENDNRLSPEERKRERERERLRELKRRKIRGWGGLGLMNQSVLGQGGEGRMKQGQLGVFVRRDVEDETGEVDVTMDDGEDAQLVAARGRLAEGPGSADLHLSPAPVSSPTVSAGKTVAHIQATQRLAERKRKPSAKASVREKNKNQKKVQLPVPPTSVEDDTDMLSDSEAKGASAAAATGKAGKPKSETYKQPWTDEEQHLLERLLEEIPDGEKNRWQKISRAMNGKRTPRQVASRVQKYFEKLKKFGVS